MIYRLGKTGQKILRGWKPILAFDWFLHLRCLLLLALSPSLLLLNCKEASEPISDFHVSRPSEVSRYWPSAIREYKEFSCSRLVDDNKPDLMADLHTKADLREGCIPVGGKFGFLWVKSGLPSVEIKAFILTPEVWIEVKCLLQSKKIKINRLTITVLGMCANKASCISILEWTL